MQLYQTHREDPPLAKNMPPVAGRIVWVRQLFRRIQEPIDYIEVGFHIIYFMRQKSRRMHFYLLMNDMDMDVVHRKTQ